MIYSFKDANGVWRSVSIQEIVDVLKSHNVDLFGVSLFTLELLAHLYKSNEGHGSGFESIQVTVVPRNAS